MKRAMVFVGGDLGDVITGDLPNADFVVAADSGFAHALKLGISVDCVVGDLDSIDLSTVGTTPVVEYPTDKDASDTELAIDYAIDSGCTHITVVGGVGGRLDHWLAVVFGLCAERWSAIEIDAIMGRSRLYVVRRELELDGTPGDVISQFAVNGPIAQLTIEGLKWAGHYDSVDFGSTLCLSDVFVESHCRFTIGTGTMLVVHELGPRTKPLKQSPNSG